jgi:hypothetical protein
MISIQDIEDNLRNIVEMGQEVPHFAYVSQNCIRSIFCTSTMTYKSSYHGYSSFGIWTSVGLVHLIGFSCMTDNEVIFSHSRNIIIDIMNKLGVRENTIYR